jgi:hypothetical protein
MSKVFTDHPPTAERITAIKHEIETILPDRGQYVVSSSEFDTVKSRLMSIENGRTASNGRPNDRHRRRPNTRRTPRQDDPTVQYPSSDPQQSDDDGPPVLKRKD